MPRRSGFGQQARLIIATVLQEVAAAASAQGMDFARESAEAWRAGRLALPGDGVVLVAEVFEAIAAGDVIQGRHIVPGGVLAGGLKDGMLGAGRGA